MKRVAKPAGKFNVVLEDAPIPEPGPDEVRVKAVRSLISRGSEIGRRYTREEAIDPEIMGYCLTGVVDAVGEGIEHLAVGERVVAIAPHAQYVARNARTQSLDEHPLVFPIWPEVSFDQATYSPLVRSSVLWVDAQEIQRDDTVVILGQGLVGSLVMQVAKANGNGRIVAVDATDLRCELAAELGADEVINAAKEDPIRAVRKLTNGVGAEIVVYAVGGPAGPKAFEQAQDMLAVGGLLHLLGLYEDQPLPIYSSKMQRRRLLGNVLRTKGVAAARRSMDLLAAGAIGTERMTTHHFPYTQTPEAFDLLYNRLGDTLGVILDWDAPAA